MSDTKAMKSSLKKRVVFIDMKSKPTNTNNNIRRNSITTQKLSNLTSHRRASIQTSLRLKRPLISQRRLSIQYQVKKTNITEEETIMTPKVENLPEKKEFLNEIESQTTLDLLEKIRQTAHAESIGPMPLSLQACRFELPFDLKLLETLTPLDYLSKYCHLSSRRQYQFKRLFDKYRNRNYNFDSSYLHLSLLNIHKHHLTYEIFDYLCQLIGLDDEQYQFTFNTYAGVLALCERIVYRSSLLYKDQDDYNLMKDTIEKCDFYSLERKFDGFIISDAMKQLLNAL